MGWLGQVKGWLGVVKGQFGLVRVFQTKKNRNQPLTTPNQPEVTLTKSSRGCVSGGGLGGVVRAG